MIAPEYTKAFREANYHQINQYVRFLLEKAGRERTIPGRLEELPALREALCREIGYPPYFRETRQAPFPETLLAEEDGLQFYRLIIPVAEGLDCYGILIKPQGTGPHPLCILLHGAVGCPEMITGLHMTANYYDAGKVLAKEGWMVYAPLTMFRPILDGDASIIPQDARLRANLQLQAADTTLVALELLKIRKATDVLLRRPDVIPGRAGIAGLSFGGFYTLLCAATDQRFDPIYSSCFFADQLPVFRMREDLSLSEFVWRGSGKIGCRELALLCCPRRLILEAGVGDALFPIDNVRKETAWVRQAYETLGHGDSFRFVEHSGQHEFGLSEALQWFRWKEDP